MSQAIVILAAETPLREYLLAGQSSATFLRDAASRITSRILETELPSAQLVDRVRAWLDQDVELVLMIRDDRPLVTSDTLASLLAYHAKQEGPLSVLWTQETGFAAACTRTGWLLERLDSAGPSADWEQLAQAEITRRVQPEDPRECLVMDSLPALAEAERIVRQRINLAWMQAGIRIVDPATTYLDATVTIGRGTIILPNTHVWGRTAIGEMCRLGPNSIVRDTTIGDRCVVIASMLEEAMMEEEAHIGPFGHLRPGAHLCQGVHMGNFGEVKNSVLGRNAKMGHFSYLGDAVVGENVNIGAGTIACNYDGVRKHKTVIHEDAFIGSGTMLVAPVEIGAGARIGAGSVVTHDVPAGAVAYGVPARIRQQNEVEGEERGSGK